MIVLLWMLPDHFIRLPDALSFQFNDFVDQSFYNSDSKVVILSSIAVVYDYKILMNRNQELLHV